VGRIAGERRHHAEDLASAERHLDARADFDPSGKLRRDDVIELAAEGDLKGDTGDIQRRAFSRAQDKNAKCEKQKPHGTTAHESAELKKRQCFWRFCEQTERRDTALFPLKPQRSRKAKKTKASSFWAAAPRGASHIGNRACNVPPRS
jgi:hypothetical protein